MEFRRVLFRSVRFFFTEISAVSTGAEASKDLQDILDDAVYPLVNSAELKQHIQDAADLLKRALADDIGAFSALQQVIGCAANPAIDSDEFTGSFYDLLVQPEGIEVAAVLDLFREAVSVDEDGQVIRALHGLVAAMVSDEQALDASRAAVAEALCGPEAQCTGAAFAKGMLPAVTLLVERGALGDLLTLLSDVLDGCGK